MSTETIELHQKYKILHKLAEGASSIVYRAQTLSQRQEVAIKVLKAELHEDAESRARFRREVLVSNQLTHPSAVHCYDEGQLANKNPWIAMELIEGQTLDERLTQGPPLTEQEALDLLGTICDLLSEAHQKGILHRDLKAHHILLSPEGPRVIDFGLAGLRDAETLTHSDIMAGSPEYMAPEQWDGLHNADARSDLYSLGLIAYQCLAGRLPFEANTLPGWMNAHFHVTPTPLSSLGVLVSPWVERAILRSISKQPQERQQSALEFKNELTSSD